jgi:hypothetical protein
MNDQGLTIIKTNNELTEIVNDHLYLKSNI